MFIWNVFNDALVFRQILFKKKVESSDICIPSANTYHTKIQYEYLIYLHNVVSASKFTVNLTKNQ